MKSATTRILVTTLALVALAACEGGGSSDPAPTAPVKTTEAPDVAEHESGPESPIAYGLFVPDGATQLGPLIRYRSNRLIAAYQPELDAAVAQSEAEAAEKINEDEAAGTPSPTPTPTPTTRPSPDSFNLLENAPRADTAVSLMRIDGDPTEVLRRMLAQIDAALPQAGVDVDDLSTYCRSRERRITRCAVDISGETPDERPLRIVLDVDPGDVATRTSPPSNLTQPVMQLTVAYDGDPRSGQIQRPSGDLEDLADIDTPEVSGLIWPKMDEDAPSTTPLVNGWVAPVTANILLSGFRPQFVMIDAPRAAVADQIAASYVDSQQGKHTIVKDVSEDLNTVTTSYSVRVDGGGTARALHIISARGNYAVLFYAPPTN